MLRLASTTLFILLPILQSAPVFSAEEAAQQAAAVASTNWTEVNLAVTDAQVIPSYNAFAVTTAELQTQAAGFCAAPDAKGLSSLKEHFHATMDSWQRVQHIQFGPITYFNWNFRVQFWPDDNGTGARQLTQLLAAQDPAILEPESFARQSVGVQGFQALETLLFDADSLDKLSAEPYRCAVLQAVIANLDEIASGVAQRWETEFRTAVAQADESRDNFENAEDATIDFMKALVEPVRRIKEQKLDAVLGETLAAARPRRAENWRSERELRNIKLNVQSLEQLFTAAEPPLSSVLQAADVELVDAAFATLLGHLNAQPDSLAQALQDEAGHAALLETAKQLDALFEALEASLKNTDLYLGFNSLDGD